MGKKAWKQEDSTLVRTFADGRELNIELSDLFKNWEDLEEVQQHCVANGVKQKLTDILAVGKDNPLTEAEKYQKMEEKWEDIAINRQWNANNRVGRGPSVQLATLIPALLQAGFGPEQIAQSTGKPLEVIQKEIDKLN